MIKQTILFITMSIFLNAQEYKNISDTKFEKILQCLYKDFDAKEILREEGLDNSENIENLLYADKHKKEYFLKALTLDYLYKSRNIEDIYKKAFDGAKIDTKVTVGIYYVMYLQKVKDYEEAIRILRGLDLIASKKVDIPRKIAYIYAIANQKKDSKTENYLKLKKIDLNEIGDKINECSK